MLINLLTTQLLALALFERTAPRELKARVPRDFRMLPLRKDCAGEIVTYFCVTLW